ncbi:hypothetical protein OKW45_001156 [Paraburkholderia sp. WSM4175]
MAWADLDGRLTLGVHGVQPSQIGTAFIDGYGFGRAILIDGLLELPLGRFLVPPGSQQEVNRLPRNIFASDAWKSVA